MKYELVRVKDIVDGLRWRAKALKSFGKVKKGDLSGLIQNSNSISQKGRCWVFPDARMYGSSQIFDNAEMHDKARMFDDAEMRNNSKMFGNAKMYNSSIMYDKSKMFDDSVLGNRGVLQGKEELRGDDMVIL